MKVVQHLLKKRKRLKQEFEKQKIVSLLKLPRNVPIKNVKTGTFIIGEAILINQFGKNGVIRKNII